MEDVISPLLLLILGAVLGVGTLILVSVWRSMPHRKMFYILLVFYELLWASFFDKVCTFVGVSRPWRNGVQGVIFVMAGATLVLLYRHRRDPDPSSDEP